ncbi:MAG: C10 family peptidase [Paramuribaculum sp.]|nr:C10 family peptidase [Paramuribaculum sp.]
MPSDVIDRTTETDLNGIVLTVPDTLSTVNQNRAAEIASKFFGKRYPESRADSRDIAEIKTISDINGKELMHVVNFADNKGFVIVSAEKGYYPIIAQSDEGNFNADNTDSPAYMWLMSQKYNVAKCTELPDSVKSDIAQAWTEYDYKTGLDLSSRSDYIDKPQVYYDSLRMWSLNDQYKVYNYNDFILTDDYLTLSDDEKYQITSNIIMLGNSNYGTKEDVTLVLVKDYTHYANFPKTLLKTQWGQGKPYNNAVPNNYPLGCTTIAAGQIMNYHRWPSYYDWNNMYYSSSLLADFLYGLAKKIGVSFKENGSPGPTSGVLNALKQQDYTVTHIAHNTSKVMTEIKNKRPVYMDGSGTSVHAWVCDGIDSYTYYHEIRIMTLPYRPTAQIIPTEMIEAIKILKPIYSTGYRYHMNWGWYGTADGFYLDNSMNPKVEDGNYSYNKNRTELLIIPNK